MATKETNYLFMYYEIKRLHDNEHYPLRRISDYLKLNTDFHIVLLPY